MEIVGVKLGLALAAAKNTNNNNCQKIKLPHLFDKKLTVTDYLAHQRGIFDHFEIVRHQRFARQICRSFGFPRRFFLL
jgi:hypothetical protein